MRIQSKIKTESNTQLNWKYEKWEFQLCTEQRKLTLDDASSSLPPSASASSPAGDWDEAMKQILGMSDGGGGANDGDDEENQAQINQDQGNDQFSSFREWGK